MTNKFNFSFNKDKDSIILNNHIDYIKSKFPDIVLHYDEDSIIKKIIKQKDISWGKFFLSYYISNYKLYNIYYNEFQYIDILKYVYNLCLDIINKELNNLEFALSIKLELANMFKSLLILKEKEKSPQNFYISDTHFGHENVIKFENRPFKNINEMSENMIKLWNNKVKENDTVYILGDMFYGKEINYENILSRLNGYKILIKGNHDQWIDKNIYLSKYFIKISDYKIINDNGKQIVLFHYPILDWAYKFNGAIHLYGHIHSMLKKDLHLLTDIQLKELNLISEEKNMYNVSADVINYSPCTLGELEELNEFNFPYDEYARLPLNEIEDSIIELLGENLRDIKYKLGRSYDPDIKEYMVSYGEDIINYICVYIINNINLKDRVIINDLVCCFNRRNKTYLRSVVKICN